MDRVRLNVVAAALVDGHHVLAALRVDPAGWEFPGGKIEPGETPQQALERECLEELGVEVRCGRHVATACSDRIELQIWQAQLLAGTPTAGHDHRELRWVGRTGLADLDWLPLDRDVLDAVTALLPVG